ncbi:hypothetical protein EZS27_027527 [termite gut metagenome]|uniref:ABC transporter permease n=1 Tax=termite gut metagenome TaxID=433724 RepID=A0A5J4QPJ6_9ZZZZ
MIKQILKQIWNERRSNAWLWAELLLVSVVLWVIVDCGYVTLRVYLQPHGFNIEHTYQLYFNELNLKSSNYIPADRKTGTFGEDFWQQPNGSGIIPMLNLSVLPCFPLHTMKLALVIISLTTLFHL